MLDAKQQKLSQLRRLLMDMSTKQSSRTLLAEVKFNKDSFDKARYRRRQHAITSEVQDNHGLD